MDEDLKKYADSLYENARMESSKTLQKARVKAAQERASRNRGDLPLSGLDVQAILRIFDDHIERCMVARFDSYHEAYAQTGRTPSEQDLTNVLNECQAVMVLEIGHSAKAIKEFISSRAAVGVPGQDVQATVENNSAHGHDRVLRKWKIWKAKVQLKPTAANVLEPEKRRDVLLPIYNRTEFDRDLVELVSKGTEASPVALVFMDLDKFKSINDGPGGHEAGDRALKTFAEAVLRACAGKGTAYRYGGDELCILLPNHSLDESAAVAERVRREVCAIRTDELTDGLRTSIGVACFPESTTNPSKLVSQADGAMFTSKKAGGNRVSNAENG